MSQIDLEMGVSMNAMRYRETKKSSLQKQKTKRVSLSL